MARLLSDGVPYSTTGWGRHTAAWSDVKAKGRRILENGDYIVSRLDGSTVVAEVMGDNDFYTVVVHSTVRVDTYDKNDYGVWLCTCTWADWAYNREMYKGRMCSHAYAMHLLLQREREKRRKRKKRSSRVAGYGGIEDAIKSALAGDPESAELLADYEVVSGPLGEALIGIAMDFGAETEDVLEAAVFHAGRASSHARTAGRRTATGRGFRKRHTSTRRVATRFFTPEEKQALLDEEGVSWHYQSGMFD